MSSIAKQIAPPALSPLSSADVGWVAVSAWVGFIGVALLEHLCFGQVFGLAEALAVLSSAAAGGGLLAFALALFARLFLPLWSWSLCRWPGLLFRLELALLVALSVETLWCLADYYRDPRLPVLHPHPTIYALGLIPSLLLGLLVFRRSRRSVSLSSLLLLRLGFLGLACFGLRWIQGFSINTFRLPLSVVIFFILGALSALWVRSPRRRLSSLGVGAVLLLVSLFGWRQLANSYWARDAALRGGRLSFASFQLARYLFLSQQNGLVSLASSATQAPNTPGEGSDALKERILQTKPKNLLLITVDSLRADFGGTGERLPAFERLQQEGVRFLGHRAGAPGTIESMRTLFLGAYPWMKIQGKTFFQLAQEGGFYTLGVLPNSYIVRMDGGWLRQGFEVLAYDLPYPFPTAPVAMPMTDLLLEKLGDVGDKPFVAWVHYIDPHKPYDAEGDTDRARYVGEVQSNDRALGKLLDGLEARGLLANTLIVLSADHGEEFYEHGGATHGLTLYEEIVHVPMMIRAPGGVVRGEITQDTAAADLSPTMLSLMGLTAPEGFAPFGRDLFEVNRERVVFSFGRLTASGNTGEASAVRGGAKLIYNFQMQSAQLYDVNADPFERNNLIAQQPTIAAELAQALLGELQQSGLQPR